MISTSCACLTVRELVGADGDGSHLERDGDHRVHKFELTLNPAGMEGSVTKQAYITFDDGTTETLTVSVNVKTRLALDRQDAAFGVVGVSDGARRLSARLKGELAAARKIVAIEGPKDSFFSVTATADGQGVTVALPQKRASGLHAETWIVRTDDKEIPEIKFPVSVTVSSAVAVTPSTLSLAKDEGLASRFVLLRPANRKPMKVLAAETKPRRWGDVKVEARPLNGWRILIDRIDPNEVRQFSRRPYLEVKTDLPGVETLEIPLRISESVDFDHCHNYSDNYGNRVTENKHPVWQYDGISDIL